jgi:hypothetical protein
VKALWIRTDAHKVDSPEIGDLADALGVDVVTALGHFVALGGAVAEFTDDGNIRDISDTVIDRWGRWQGKRGVFAPAVRRILQSADGSYANWRDDMGKLVERREADRKRKTGGTSTEIPRNSDGDGAESRHDSSATVRDGTARNVSIPETESLNERRGAVRRESPRADASGVEVAIRPASAPPAPLDLQDLSSAGTLLLDTFYGDASPERRADIAKQLHDASDPIGPGAKLSAGIRVKARDEKHFATAVGELIADPPRKQDRAIVVFLKKLGDPPKGPTISEQHKTSEDALAAEDWRQRDAEVAEANAWLVGRPELAESINATAAKSAPGGGSIMAMVRNAARDQLLLNEWRAATTPRHQSPSKSQRWNYGEASYAAGLAALKDVGQKRTYAEAFTSRRASKPHGEPKPVSDPNEPIKFT